MIRHPNKHYENALSNNSGCSHDNSGLDKNGYLYIHYQNYDALGFIVGFNARRILRGKTPYPVLVESEEIKRSFLSIIETIRSTTSVSEEDKYAGGQFIMEKYLEGKKTGQLTIGTKATENPDIAVFKALETLEIKIGGLSRLTDNDKLYLLGHGSGGQDIIEGGADESLQINIRHYVQKLKKANLSRKIRDIRLISCESGNRKSHMKVIINGPFPAPAIEKCMGIVPAQVLSAELAAAGYLDIRVSGYKGFVAIYPLAETSPHFFKERFKKVANIFTLTSTTVVPNSESFDSSSSTKFNIDFEEKSMSTSLRASSVRQVYINGRKITRFEKAFSSCNIL